MAALSVQSIDAFIGQGNPLAKAGGARMLLRATGGNLRGAAMLAALARKESSFGAQAFVPNNFWGYGIHAGPSVNRAPSVEAMAQRVYKALVSPTGYYKKAKDPIQAISIYAPSSENNTGLYQSQVAQWLTSMGANPKADFRGGPKALDAPPVPGRSTTGTPGAVTSSSVPGGFFGLTPEEGSRFQSLLGSTTAGALQGQMPSPQFASGLSEITRAVMGRVQAAQTAAPAAGPAAPKTPGPPGPPAPGNFQGTYGIPGATKGGEGGDWGGAMPRSLALAKAVGATPSSQKRSRKHTASGGISDHWVGSTHSYATDLPTSGAAGDRLFRKVMQYLAQVSGNPKIASTSSGQWRSFHIGGYRYQVGWRVSGHYDHVHVGVERE